MKSLSCLFCGRTLTEAETEWRHAWETGACPSCDRSYDPSLETWVEVLSQDPGVVHRARNKRASMVAGGLLLIALVFLLDHWGVRTRLLLPVIVTGVSLAVYGAFHTAQKQARMELTQNDGAERLDQRR